MADMRWAHVVRRPAAGRSTTASKDAAEAWLKADRLGIRRSESGSQRSTLGVAATSRDDLPPSKRPKP
jgi:hypothetical protein